MARRDHDYYPTPPCAALALREWLGEQWARRDLPAVTRWLDPSAGPGLLLEYVADRAADRYAIELQEAFRGELAGRTAGFQIGDALDDRFTLWVSGSAIVSNPPFHLAHEFVRRAIAHAELYETIACVLLRTGWLQAAARLDVPMPDHLLLLTWRPSFDASGQTDSYSYAWLVWDGSITSTRDDIGSVQRLVRPEVPSELVAEHRRLAQGIDPERETVKVVWPR